MPTARNFRMLAHFSSGDALTGRIDIFAPNREKTSAFPASPGNPITPTIGYAPEVDETASISPYQHHHSPHLTTKHATSASSHTHSWCPCSPALTVTAPISAKSTGRSQLVWMSTLAMPEPPTIANCSRYNSIAA